MNMRIYISVFIGFLFFVSNCIAGDVLSPATIVIPSLRPIDSLTQLTPIDSLPIDFKIGWVAHLSGGFPSTLQSESHLRGLVEKVAHVCFFDLSCQRRLASSLVFQRVKMGSSFRWSDLFLGVAKIEGFFNSPIRWAPDFPFTPAHASAPVSSKLKITPTTVTQGHTRSPQPTNHAPSKNKTGFPPSRE